MLMCFYGPEFLKFQGLRHHFFGKADKIFKWLVLLEGMKVLKHWGVRQMAKSVLLPTETFQKNNSIKISHKRAICAER